MNPHNQGREIMNVMMDYWAEYSVSQIAIMFLTILCSVLAAVVMYYRMTYGTFQKCRFCLSVGKHQDIKTGKQCPECGNIHIRKDQWSKSDQDRLEYYKIEYYELQEIAQEEAEEAAMIARQEEFERQKKQKEEAEKLAAEKLAKHQADQAAIKARNDLIAEYDKESEGLKSLYCPGRVVRVLDNPNNAKHPHSERLLTKGDLIQVKAVARYNQEVSYKGIKIPHCLCVQYDRYQGKSGVNSLPIRSVALVEREDFFPGRFVRVLYPCIHPTKEDQFLEVGSIVRLTSVNLETNEAFYQTTQGKHGGTISLSNLQLVLNPLHYIEPGDIVLVKENSVKATYPDKNEFLNPGEKVEVHYVRQSGERRWPQLTYDHDLITYRAAHKSTGLNYLPLNDVEIVQKWYEKELAETISDPQPEPDRYLQKEEHLSETKEDEPFYLHETNRWWVCQDPATNHAILLRSLFLRNDNRMEFMYYNIQGNPERLILDKNKKGLRLIHNESGIIQASAAHDLRNAWITQYNVKPLSTQNDTESPRHVKRIGKEEFEKRTESLYGY